MSTHTAFNNIYTCFQCNDNKCISDILKGTKNLIVHSSSYNSYSRDYTNFTQINTYKCPEIEIYPILKNKNYIPLRCQTMSVRSIRRKPHIKKLLLQMNDHIPSNARNKQCYFNNNCFITTANEFQKRCVITSRNELSPFKSNDSSNNYNCFKYKEDIFSLMDILFHDNNYNNLVYDERVIFHNDEHYNKYIIKTVEHLKKHKNENNCYHFHKTFPPHNIMNVPYTQSKISLNSMTINFINLTNKTKPTLTFHIPFALLPIFYYNNFNNIKYILLSFFTFSNTFDTITQNENELYNLIQSSSEYNSKSKQHDIINGINFFKTNSCTNVPNFKRKTKVTHIHNKSALQSNLKSLNTLVYYWYAGNYLYQVELKIPEIIVNVHNKSISKYIDTELLLFLLERNFVNWDFYIIHYLFSLKRFRKIIESTLSKQHIYSHIQHNICLSNIKMNSLSMKNNTCYFYYTKHPNKNYLYIIHSYTVIIEDKRILPKREHVFPLTLDKMKLIYDISKKEKLCLFFRKLLSINKMNLNVDLNIEMLNDFNPSKYYYYKTNDNTNNNTNNDEHEVNTHHHKEIAYSKSSNKMLLQSFSPNGRRQSGYDNNNPNNQSQDEFTIMLHHPYIEQVEYISMKEYNDNIYNRRHIKSECIVSDTTEYIHRNMKNDIIDKIGNETDIGNIIKILIDNDLHGGGCTMLSDIDTTKSKTVKKKGSVLGGIQTLKRSSADPSKIM